MKNINMSHKLYDDRGFLTKEGIVFVNDGFTKEVRKIFKQAADQQDLLVLSSILKSIIGNETTNQAQQFKSEHTNSEPLSFFDTKPGQEVKKLIDDLLKK